MIALSHQRHDSQQHNNPPNSSTFSCAPSLSYQQLQLANYLASQQQALNAPGDDLATQQYMPAAYDFSNPAIRIQQSTPTPQYPSAAAHTTPLSFNLNNWNVGGTNVQQTGTQTLQTPKNRGHQRGSSASSINSDGSHYQASSFPTYPNHLPTPSQTPTQTQFLDANSFNSLASSMAPSMNAHQSMQQALLDQNNDDDIPAFNHSARHSVSSYGHDSPATPRTAQGDDTDGAFKAAPSGETLLRRVDSWLFDEFVTYDDPSDLRQHTNMQKMDGQMDMFGQSLLPQAQPAPTSTGLMPPARSALLSSVNHQMHLAQNMRSHTPSTTASRAASPFLPNSPYNQAASYDSPRVRLGTAAEARQQTMEAAAGHALKTSDESAELATISPKDALLEYHPEEDAKPLFADGGASDYSNQYSGGDNLRTATQPNLDSTISTTSDPTFQRDVWPSSQYASNIPSSQNLPFSFASPALPNSLQGGGLAYAHYRTAPAVTDPVPDFPQFLRMESSASEAEPQNSQQSATSEPLQKPASSTADSGTYTCTYHGCTQRFETPQKLQRHKREGHRNAHPNAIGTTMTSAQLLERNSQAGPHKCERINPTTGKPCNTIFSRPYDLTRHEDTIHNARKQKVRCALCQEEKTFSRNDALTRHMRVVHPHVDFPGKHKRRGAH
ncbi:hypothetical protein M011DRAFT_412739 [Sporormia fimetaria CBS 119925]|uniref:C2H2-type domain-containing protein n=1 Tax=Sporormia fimetaria CBS 119925 TaxID=1340428 RepID=A0A6A6UZB3_9PLEO|nr:hypothetical protein M011DRAFT_412739 [Sporormia fimetaria CBS 119925]